MEKNWTDARETCLNINSDLASIKGEEENKFVGAAFFIGKLAWIGLRHGTGVWTDGSNATYFAITLQTSVNLTSTRLLCARQHVTMAHHILFNWSEASCLQKNRFVWSTSPQGNFIPRSVFATIMYYHHTIVPLPGFGAGPGCSKAG